ncbi:hypothetical protein VTN77DRAFT_4946 [Rasamsonia byssochlamydoides]|uniref:uncharacterized protein n=1 Tax=Rasamsonia byssochlamydoides TaxID=89139 RepID=UPI0037427EE4
MFCLFGLFFPFPSSLSWWADGAVRGAMIPRRISGRIAFTGSFCFYVSPLSLSLPSVSFFSGVTRWSGTVRSVSLASELWSFILLRCPLWAASLYSVGRQGILKIRKVIACNSYDLYECVGWVADDNDYDIVLSKIRDLRALYTIHSFDKADILQISCLSSFSIHISRQLNVM